MTRISMKFVQVGAVAKEMNGWDVWWDAIQVGCFELDVGELLVFLLPVS